MISHQRSYETFTSVSKYKYRLLQLWIASIKGGFLSNHPLIRHEDHSIKFMSFTSSSALILLFNTNFGFLSIFDPVLMTIFAALMFLINYEDFSRLVKFNFLRSSCFIG